MTWVTVPVRRDFDEPFAPNRIETKSECGCQAPGQEVGVYCRPSSGEDLQGISGHLRAHSDQKYLTYM